MKIIIELDHYPGSNKTFQYSTDKTGFKAARTCRSVQFCCGFERGAAHAIRVGPECEKHNTPTRSTLVIKPLPGCEEEVERFIAVGRLKNEFFPFLISEGELDGDSD